MEIWERLSKAAVPVPIPPIVIIEDSCTGYCQIFASTAIAAYNFAIDKGIISGTKYDSSDWHDFGDVWSNLHYNPESASLLTRNLPAAPLFLLCLEAGDFLMRLKRL